VFALQTRKALTIEQINEACYVDMRANKDVFESMRKNPKVKYDGERFSYKVTFMEAYMCTVSTPLCVHFYAPSLVCDIDIAFGL